MVDNSQNIDLEDEFNKLLDDFIAENKTETTTSAPNQENNQGLEELLTSDDEKLKNNNQTNDPLIQGLDDLITDKSDNQTKSEGVEQNLDGFLTGENTEKAQTGLDSLISDTNENQNTVEKNQTDNASELNGLITQQESQNPNNLKEEELELANAFSGFQDGIKMLASKKNLKIPNLEYSSEELYPNYKPSIGKKIAQFLIESWDLIYKYDPQTMKKLNKNATDEDYLSFAENLQDEELQFTIYSYIETLYNLENCEIVYNEKLDTMQKNRIKKELYEEYVELQRRKLVFIQKLKEKDFPIDVDKLINNYFHIAQKDADGAFKALVNNPAMFSPIEFSKIKPRFFGLVKVSPEDGVKANRRIGNFIKKLKV